MSIQVVIMFKVQDFDQFKSAFTAAERFRTEAGLTAKGYRNLDDPNSAVVIGTAPTKEAFVSFFSSQAQQERMKNAGLTEPPSVTFIEAI